MSGSERGEADSPTPAADGWEKLSARSLADAFAELDRGFSGTLSVAARNDATGEQIYHNAHEVLPSASVIKLAVLVELFRRAGEGSISLAERHELAGEERVAGSGVLKDLEPGVAPTLLDYATLMTVVSDNTATNVLIDRLGGPAAVNATMRDRLGLPSIVLHRKVDFTQENGKILRLGEATAAELLTLVSRLVRGELLGRQPDEAMAAILRRQQYLDQVPRLLDFSPYKVEIGQPQQLTLGSKTGFMPGTHADVGFIELPLATISYAVLSDGSADLGLGADSEGSVVAGMVGRLLVERWWVGAGPPPLRPLSSYDIT